jgi:hypothetical protein
LATGWLGNVTSLRYIGSSDALDTDAVNLYDGLAFQGNQTLLLVNAPEVHYEFKSLAISGSSPITFYTLPFYGGLSICVQLKHSDKNYTLIENVEAQFGIGSNLVQSIQFGCNSENILDLKPIYRPSVEV